GGAGLCATIWAVIIPAVLAIKARKKFPNQMFTGSPQNSEKIVR
ncbi:aromatic amino acid transport family protein, partial [Escherichia coli]